MNFFLWFFDDFGDILTDAVTHFAFGNVRLKDDDIENGLFVLPYFKFTKEATEKSPYPELIVILTQRLSLMILRFVP